jgi:pilus assembly protein CpaF
LDYSRDISDTEIKELIDSVLEQDARMNLWRVSYRRQMGQELFHSLRGWDVLQQLLDRDDITEIMVNGYDKVFVEREGRLEASCVRFESEEKLRDVIGRMVSKCNRQVNDSSPIVDARLFGGERINVVLPPVAVGGATLTIRKFLPEMTDMDKLVRLGSLDKEMADFLGCLVGAGYNILISGGTGSGKTTLLGALSAFIPKDQRVITIEDSAELQIQGIPNLVRLETRNANLEGSHEVSIRDLLRTALRMRPTRIIVGEVRGKEAADLLQCLNTGHAGSMSTGHANSSKDMLSRLEMMVLMGVDIPLSAIRAQIAAGIDIVVHLGRVSDGSRKIMEISEVIGMVDDQIHLNRLFSFKETQRDKGKVMGIFEKENDLQHCDKLQLFEESLSAHIGD